MEDYHRILRSFDFSGCSPYPARNRPGLLRHVDNYADEKHRGQRCQRGKDPLDYFTRP